ncbi:Peptidase A1 domain-containing protein [Mycena chlorophos]|uniref:Peptidase A1 domain-containing protein n=1 Tax=Mycena chlorophos TaxID=658473 RepID=A0A8H6TL07_MYCCL|nr:Peptidase A1 domain-containing protein [Mycena chlorophos]
MSTNNASSRSCAFTTQVRVAEGKTIVDHDMLRSRHLRVGANPHGPMAVMMARQTSGGPKHLQQEETQSVNVVNASVTYLANVGVGDPAQTFQLLIDTGSSNTWITNEHDEYKPTKTATDMRKHFQLSYGKGDCEGNEYLDTVTLGENIVIKNQSIGVASRTDEMGGMSGILGIGPTGLTKGTVTDSDEQLTVMDNLMQQGTIAEECIGIYYAPTMPDSTTNTGSLCFGGPDASKFTGEINWIPLTKQAPANRYWGIDQSISYGRGGPTIMATCAGISDTGTTLIMLPDAAFNEYMKQTGAVMDDATGLPTVTDAQLAQMQSLLFKIGDQEYELIPNAQLWPRAQNTTLGGDANKNYLAFSSMGTMGNEPGLQFINGYAFLQRFYSAYDTTNCRLGMAMTAHTMDETN